jgi:hypothetical protein
MLSQLVDTRIIKEYFESQLTKGNINIGTFQSFFIDNLKTPYPLWALVCGGTWHDRKEYDD